jgi:hypothetical protein
MERIRYTYFNYNFTSTRKLLSFPYFLDHETTNVEKLHCCLAILQEQSIQTMQLKNCYAMLPFEEELQMPIDRKKYTNNMQHIALF